MHWSFDFKRIITHTDRVIAKAKAPDIIKLSWGEPAFPPSKKIREALLEAFNKGYTRYTPPAGLQELREAISDKLRRKNKIDTDPSEIIVTVGGTGALHLIFRLIAKGEVITIPNPGWFAYPSVIRVAEANLVWIDEKKYGYEALQKAREGLKRKGKELKAIVINSPSNPSGYIFSEKQLKEILDFAEDYSAYIISDEVYEDFILEGKHISIASIKKDCVFTVFSLSKTYALTGLRIGYIVAPDKQIAKELTILQLHTCVCPTSFAQYVALVCIRDRIEEEYISKWISVIKENIQYLDKKLKERGITWEKPKGGIYAWFPLPRIDSKKFAFELLEKKKVAVAVGADFGTKWDEYIRITTAVEPEIFREGIDRILQYYDEIQK